MAADIIRFVPFELDLADRRLYRDGAPVELNTRYFDALALLVREAGTLVTKDRFLQEVWRGVPVTDEALTQCVRTLRRALGDDAAAPRFIETVPKHGYRFVAAVEGLGGDVVGHNATASLVPTEVAGRGQGRAEGLGSEGPQAAWRAILINTGIGTAGAAAAGLIGGLGYGLLATSQPGQSGAGGSSVLLVLLSLTLLAALVGGAGVAFGMAVAGGSGQRPSAWVVAGGATGGLLAGGIAKLLGLDAFDLLLGQSPGEITGAAEGAVLGASVGLGAWVAGQSPRPFALRRSIAAAAFAGAAGGLLITLVGGRLMGGSLDLLAGAFPTSRIRLDHVGTWFGEPGFGLISRAVTSALEGAVFAACIVGALALARRASHGRG